MNDEYTQASARIVHRPAGEWLSESALWKGVIEGRDLGTGITVLAYSTAEIGEGPAWHVHDYDEVFIVNEGRALFTIGEIRREAGPGDVLLGPAGVPHKYHNLGPGPLWTTDIHLSPDWVQTDLDDPECPD